MTLILSKFVHFKFFLVLYELNIYFLIASMAKENVRKSTRLRIVHNIV